MRNLCGIVAIVLISVSQSQVFAQTEDEAGRLFYSKHIEPILRTHCAACHSSSKKKEASLAVDSRTALLKGGENGPAIDLHAPEKSLLLRAIRQQDGLEMPPDKRLAVGEIELIERWIRMGAPFRADGTQPDDFEQRVKRAANHWAFQPLARSAPPDITAEHRDWIQNDIDRFVLSKLISAGLEPAAQADRVTLIRRLSFDLLGLPPKAAEVQQFVEDTSPNAWEDLVDRYLDSPHYGERWGRHWLDLARYADSSGFHNDLDRPFAWKYRDWVIDSFNQDKPYADFVAEQLAGDEVAGANESTLIATGFCRNGPSNDDNMGKTEAALKQYRADQLDDVISTTSTVFLGVTIGCARCHDHKTDPISTKDYYSLMAIFSGTEKAGLVPGTKDAKGKKIEESNSLEIQALVETKATPPITYVMRRGNASNLGELVEPQVPAVLPGGAIAFPTPASDGKSSLRRISLAHWITSPENALTWRVLANRIWQHHFGQGIVATPGNFGFTGEPPSHPELLDYLAARLIAGGGRWKPLHKLIVTSATYQQQSQRSSAAASIDPKNRLLSHRTIRRMEAEVIRDSMLAASGNLNPDRGGPGIKPRLPPELIPASQRNKWPAVSSENASHWKRSVYIYSKRQLLLPMMELFDAPATTDSCVCRTQSHVPTQALLMMNDEFVETQAEHLARRACDGSLDRAADHPRACVERLFELTLSHVPDEPRLRQAEQFVLERTADSTPLAALTDLAHVIFNSSQFVTIP